jgi:hypothetical protein
MENPVKSVVLRIEIMPVSGLAGFELRFPSSTVRTARSDSVKYSGLSKYMIDGRGVSVGEGVGVNVGDGTTVGLCVATGVFVAPVVGVVVGVGEPEPHNVEFVSISISITQSPITPNVLE